MAGTVAYNPFYVVGASYGGLVGGDEDAAKLALVHLGGGAVDDKRLLSTHAAGGMRRVSRLGGRTEIGLGWCRPRGETRFVQHLGGGSGFSSVMRIYPDRDLGVLMMANVTSYKYGAIIGAILDCSW